jgi:simple sugar transport system permease protein
VGENPSTADAAGINVTKNKYLATCIGAGISGLGGLYYVMDYTKGTWANDRGIEAWAGWPWRWSSSPPGNPSTPSGALICSDLLFWVYLYIPGLTRSHRAVQDAPLPGHHRGADRHLFKKPEREPAAGKPGAVVFP